MLFDYMLSFVNLNDCNDIRSGIGMNRFIVVVVWKNLFSYLVYYGNFGFGFFICMLNNMNVNYDSDYRFVYDDCSFFLFNLLIVCRNRDDDVCGREVLVNVF